MHELEDFKKKNIQYQLDEQQQFQEQVTALENMIKPRFSKQALQRFGNLKAAHPDKAVQLLVVVSQLLQSQNIEVIDDEQLKDLLTRLAPQKKETKIIRK